jgi:magnesium-transporting ATPase (P-type)
LFASSIVFASLVAYEFARLFDIRTDYKMGIFSNRLLWGGMLLSFAITLSLLYVPTFGDLFKLTPPAAIDWLIMSIAAGSLVICMKLLNPVLDRIGLRGE